MKSLNDLRQSPLGPFLETPCRSMYVGVGLCLFLEDLVPCLLGIYVQRASSALTLAFS